MSVVFTYICIGVIVGIICINITHDSIEDITSHYNESLARDRYNKLCFKIVITSIVVWPVYVVAIIIPHVIESIIR